MEDQIYRIQGRDRLRALIDQLGDEEEMLILRRMPDGSYEWHCYGDLTMSDALYMVEAYKHWMFSEE